MQFSDFAECPLLGRKCPVVLTDNYTQDTFNLKHSTTDYRALPYLWALQNMQISKQRYTKKDVLEPLICFDFHFTERTISSSSCVAAAWPEKFELFKLRDGGRW